MWTGEKDSDIYTLCGRVFLVEDRDKKIRFKKYSDPCGPSSLVFSVKLKKQLLFNCANFYVVFFGCKRDKNK